MHIGIVGGLERYENEFHSVAQQLGCKVTFHGGDVRGHGSASLLNLVVAVDWLIVVTDINSHGGVILARRLARRYGKRVDLQRRLRPGRLAEVIVELKTGGNAAHAATEL